jgi:hypothetical protein
MTTITVQVNSVDEARPFELSLWEPLRVYSYECGFADDVVVSFEALADARDAAVDLALRDALAEFPDAVRVQASHIRVERV